MQEFLLMLTSLAQLAEKNVVAALVLGAIAFGAFSAIFIHCLVFAMMM